MAKAKKKKIETSEEPKNPVGIQCPKCGCGHFYTTHSRPISGGRVRRYKSCRHCGRQVRTTEKIEAAEYAELLRLKEENKL